jgi:hypothetical protein
MGNMREISIEECNAVFGGTDPDEDVGTVVTGGKKYYDNSISSFGGFGSGSFGYGGWGGLGDFTPPEGYDLAMVDTDDDGVPDSLPIVVTAGGTALEAGLADAIASRHTDTAIAIMGFLTGTLGWELAVALRAVGVSEIATASIVGTLTANGVPTSLPDIVGQMRSELYDVVFDTTLNDIHNNPDKYQRWMQNPFNGDFFDANSPPYNQFD